MDAAASARVLSSKPVNIQGGSYNPGSRGWGAGGTWADAVRNGAAPGRARFEDPQPRTADE